MERFYGCMLQCASRLRLIRRNVPRGDCVLTPEMQRERRERQRFVRRLRAIVLQGEAKRWGRRVWVERV